jgi:hypothetical protein
MMNAWCARRSEKNASKTRDAHLIEPGNSV